MKHAQAHWLSQPDAAEGLPLGLGMLLLVPIALAGNELGVLLRYPDLGAAVLFPPYAVLTAVLVTSPRRHWIWYILAAAAAHEITSFTHWTLSWVLFADAANVVRSLVAAILIRRFLSTKPRLNSITALFVFIASASIAAPAVAAFLGAANVVVHDPTVSYWRIWTAWFMSNALTALMMLPMLLAVTSYPELGRVPPVSARRLIEGLSLAVLLGITCEVGFFGHGSSPWALALLFYAPLPMLIWAALRFGPAGASLALTGVAIAAIWGADSGAGPFIAVSQNHQVLTVQLLLLLTGLPVLCIAVVANARHGAVELYRALLASLQDHVAILDARGLVLQVNESWMRYALIPSPCPFERAQVGDNFLAACRDAAEQVERSRPEETNHASRRALNGVAAVLNGDCKRFEMEYEQTSSGRHEWFFMRAEALERLDGGAVLTRANITARHRAQLEVEEQRRELSHLGRVAVLGQLSGALAHELRQPLSSILANAEAGRRLLRHQSIDVEELRAILQDIVNEDRRAAQVITGLRAMVKRGEMRIHPIQTDELVRDVMELAHAELITRRVTATTTVEPNLPPLLGDRVQMQQLLLNLILNACEAMSSTVSGDRALSLSAFADEAGNTCFDVRDSGPGIPPALIDRLFEPFVTTKAEGLGLGLSISRAIVVAHGGRVWAENNPTRGATVHCVLPSLPPAHTPDHSHAALRDTSLEAKLPA